MAHLIKLEDYISRYQYDIQRYPNQFTRIKKERWYYLKNEWEQKQNELYTNPVVDENTIDELVTEGSFFAKLKKLLPGKRSVKSNEIKTITTEKKENSLVTQARDLQHLKQLFLEELFVSQLRWASSSLLEQSSLHPKYKWDPQLRFFSQHLPDNYFVMYYPIFWVKQARVDLEIILISPSDVSCISVLEGSGPHSIFEARADRFWLEYMKEDQKKVLSPLVSLNRMASIVQETMNKEECSLPVKKIVLAKDSLVDHQSINIGTEIVDKRSFDKWHEKLKNHPSPLKSQQIKVAKALLEMCQTTAFKRQDLSNDE